MTALIVAVFVLGAGTFAFRFAGPMLRERMTLSPRVETLLGQSTVVLLVALVATTATLEGGEFVGVARPAGVLVGGYRRNPEAPSTCAPGVGYGRRQPDP